MGSKWNCGGCNGQCAHCHNGSCNGNVGSDTSEDCCDTCGLNTAALGHYPNGAPGGCGNTASADSGCCQRCALTINPDGSQMNGNQQGARANGSGRTGGSCRGGCGQNSYPGMGGNSGMPYPNGPCGAPGNDPPPRDPCGRKDCQRAVVYAEPQQLSDMYPMEQALFQGTLFPELNKPMAAVAGCPAENCATRRQLAGFEAWEMRLYLDTHPEDACALQRWQQLCQGSCDDNYALAFTGNCAQGDCWQWARAPWPWEYQPCGRHGCGCNN